MAPYGFPDRVRSDERALNILTRPIPLLSIEEAWNIDRLANEMYNHNRHNEYILRVIAARGFAQNEMFEESAYGYDKAAQGAVWQRFPYATLKCNLRSIFSLHKVIVLRPYKTESCTRELEEYTYPKLAKSLNRLGVIDPNKNLVRILSHQPNSSRFRTSLQLLYKKPDVEGNIRVEERVPTDEELDRINGNT